MLKQKIDELMTTLNNDEDNADLVEDVKDTLQQCCRYVDTVSQEETSIQMARIRLDPADYRVFVQNIDRNRRALHEALMVNVNMLNRICAIVGMEPVANVDRDNRETYFSFAQLVVNEYYTGGKAGSATL